MIVKNYVHAEETAQKILYQCGIEDLSSFSIDDLALCRNIYIKEAELRGCEGRLLRAGGLFGIITIDSKIREPGRRRFAVAHEIGHFELHSHRNQIVAFQDNNFLNWYKTCREEEEANSFAAELLMPKSIFIKECKNSALGFKSIAQIANRFNTSLTSTAIRYVDLGPHPCILVVSEAGRIKWSWASRDFLYPFIKNGREIKKGTITFDLYNGRQIKTVPDVVMGDAWLDDFNVPNDLYLYEDVFYLKSYSTILTLLWLYDELKDL